MNSQPNEAPGHASAQRPPAGPAAPAAASLGSVLTARRALVPGSPDAAATIWSWRSRGTEAPRKSPLPGAALRSLLAGIVGAAVYRYGSHTLGIIVWSVAGAILLAALVSPHTAHAAIERLFGKFVSFVGLVTTSVLMGVVFFAIFWPMGLLTRRGRRDSMKRYYEPEAATYWKRRPEPRTAASERPY